MNNNIQIYRQYIIICHIKSELNKVIMFCFRSKFVYIKAIPNATFLLHLCSYIYIYIYIYIRKSRYSREFTSKQNTLLLIIRRRAEKLIHIWFFLFFLLCIIFVILDFLLILICVLLLLSWSCFLFFWEAWEANNCKRLPLISDINKNFLL